MQTGLIFEHKAFYYLTKAQDTVTLREPMREDRRYIILEHGRGGIRKPYLLPDAKNHPLNILEKANLISYIYEIIASSNPKIGEDLVIKKDHNCKQCNSNAIDEPYCNCAEKKVDLFSLVQEYSYVQLEGKKMVFI